MGGWLPGNETLKDRFDYGIGLVPRIFLGVSA